MAKSWAAAHSRSTWLAPERSVPQAVAVADDLMVEVVVVAADVIVINH